MKPVIERVLDDGAADDQTLKDFFQREWEIELLAPINPRRRGPITKDLPRGIDHLTPIGIPIGRQGYPLECLTYRHDTGGLSSRRLRAKTGFLFVGSARHARNVTAETRERVA